MRIPKKFIVGACVIAAMVVFASVFLYQLGPVDAGVSSKAAIFEVKQGQGFRDIAGDLRRAGLLRSSAAAEIFSLLTGTALRMQPGLYRLSPAMSAPEILRDISGGGAKEVAVTIPEGVNLYQIDAILESALVIRRGELVSFAANRNLEGKLFPDTYRFFTGSDVRDVAQKFLDNFSLKAAPLLDADKTNAEKDLIVASLVDKEVPDPEEQKMVAGIIWKRLKAGMPLNVDATICYLKFERNPVASACYPLASSDYKIDSAYNTYLRSGLPSGPIGNPGISAIKAAISPQSSPYWYYLSDPKTEKTVFARTLDEQSANRLKYLKVN
jgi:UPF0755 protein